ncbi:MAG: DUF3305 domain-containing protein, partial [Sneathiella sp.]|nr:DUF3305 domain-containing protein [Sneathiella sp.]
PLGIVVERRKSDHPWAKWIWKPVSVFINGAPDAEWVKLIAGENWIQYHAATLPLVLHRKETEALRLNLSLDVPELYVVLQENDLPGAEFPLDAHLVTASSYDMQDYMDAGDDIIEKVRMPEEIAAFIQAFVEEHHMDEVFIKRKRDRLDLEEQKFGKEPIFTNKTIH